MSFSTSDIPAGITPFALNVKDYGATGNGTTDDLAAINSAINAADAQGGGIVYFPVGVYRITDSLILGDGTSSTQSTKHHRVRLIGNGSGVHTDVSSVEYMGATVIKYDGSTSSSKSVVTLQGPIHNCGIEDMVLDANAKAGIGLLVDHHYLGSFKNVIVSQATAVSFKFTAQASYPTGVSYGCGENIFTGCGSVKVGDNADGIILTSRATTASSPDSCRNRFLGGTFVYGGSTGTAGVRLAYTDNNAFYGTFLLPKAPNTGGFDVVFEQVSGVTAFPHENVFFGTSGVRGCSGTSGTSSNNFVNLCTSDGFPIPNIANINVSTADGREYIGGQRTLRVRQEGSASRSSGTVTTSNSTATLVTSMSVTLTTIADSYLKMGHFGNSAKDTSGSGYVEIFLDGTVVDGSLVQTDANGYFKPVNFVSPLISVSAGSHTIEVKQRNGGSNTNTYSTGTLWVQEQH